MKKKKKNEFDEYLETLDKYREGTDPIPSWHQNGGE